MLHDLIDLNRDSLLAVARVGGVSSAWSALTLAEAGAGPASFLKHLSDSLRAGAAPAHGDGSAIRATAAQYGASMLRHGFSLEEVVRSYADVSAAVAAVAREQKLEISIAEFQAFTACLSDALAAALGAYAQEKDARSAAWELERLGSLAHEIRNELSTALLTFEVMRTGAATTSSGSMKLHERTLGHLVDLVDRSLLEVRLGAGAIHAEHLHVASMLNEIALAVELDAESRGLAFTAEPVDPELVVHVDRALIASAIRNIVQNALKQTRPRSRVSLRAYPVESGRVRIEVEDECGGLPTGDPESMFKPFERRGSDRSGLGLGLTISRRGVEANGGIISVRNKPGVGRIFAIELAIASLPVP